MTAAPLHAEVSTPLLTGNDWLSVPAIDPVGGEIRTLEVISMRAGGLLGLAGGAGEALLCPAVRIDGSSRELRAAAVEATYVDDWIPAWKWDLGGVEVRSLVVAPPDCRGLVVRLEASGTDCSEHDVELGLSIRWDAVLYSLFRSRAVAAELSCHQDAWTGSLVMEAMAGVPVVGWAVALDEEMPDDGLFRAGGDRGVRAQCMRRGRVGQGETLTATLYVTVAPEADGARTTAVDMRRHGYEALLGATRRWLATHRVGIQDVPALDRRLRRNALFTRFFSCGYTLDTGEWVAVTSRSPRYYVSAAFWSRDTLLWSLPGLLIIDRDAARRTLLSAFRYGWRHPGAHAQYVHGLVLYPGFELDELAAYPVALGRYVRATGEERILDEPEVRDALEAFPRVLEELAGGGPLYPTFLDPSDDPPPLPYLTYDNALLWRGVVELDPLLRRLGLAAQSGWAERTARRLRDAILATCVVEGPLGPMFAWAVDAKGSHVLYDNPPGSLQLLGELGIVAPDDPVLLRTIEWIHSPHNPHYYQGRFAAPGSAHAPRPWPMAAACALLAGERARGALDPAIQDRALALLRDAPMDGELVCESVDAQTGRVASGAAFATGAGFVAWALWEAGHRGRQ